jgi:hypothetical protein
MAEIFDPRGDQHFKLDVPMLCAGACTYGYAVSADSSGDITNAATSTLTAVCGIATETGAAGEVILVRILGYCGFAVTDGNVASTDLVVAAINGGTMSGATESEITADPTIAYAVVGKNLLAADSGTVGTIWVNAMGTGGGATS